MVATFKIKCRGRNEQYKEVLEKPVPVKVIISQHPKSDNIGINVECRFNTGSHGQRCKASGSNKVNCPYSCDLPLPKISWI
jgi:hypothetical protein